MKFIFFLVLALNFLSAPAFTNASIPGDDTDKSIAGSFFRKLGSISSAFGIPGVVPGGYAPIITPAGLVGRILTYLFGFLGIVFMILTIYGGWLWMTAQGNEEQVTKARKIVIDGVIGLVIMVFAYTLTIVIVNAILSKTDTGALLEP